MLRKKSMGQCFLEDRNILRLEAELAKPAGKSVLEIGAGDGRLSEAIIGKGPRSLILVEKDHSYSTFLREKFSRNQSVTIVEGDFLDSAFSDIDIILGNIPYYISSDIIFKLKGMKFERAVLMVQKEFAKKMAAMPKDDNYGRLSVTAQLAFQVKFERIVSRHLFNPVPRVDSAIIILKPTGFKMTQFQENVIRYIFQHKNKKIRNALRDSKMFERDEIERLGEIAKRRGKTLSKEECLSIASLLEKA